MRMTLSRRYTLLLAAVTFGALLGG